MRRLSLSKASPAGSTRSIRGRGALWSIASVCVVAVVALVATSASAETDTCPNEAIRAQQGVGYLPGCRAFEKVSPDDKGGFDVAGINVGGANVQVAANGSRVAYLAPGAFPGAESSGVAVSYLGSRRDGSWGTSPISPPLDPHTKIGGGSTLTLALSANLSTAVVLTNAPLTDEVTVTGPERFNLFLRDLDRGGYQLVTTVPDPAPAPIFAANARFVGASADFSRVIFEHVANLTPGATGNGSKLYEWAAGSPPSLRLVSAGFATGTAGSGGPKSGGEALGPTGSLDHVMSEDGSRIYFTTPAPAGNAVAQGSVYLQENGANTLINASERTDGAGSPEPDPAGPQPATFWMASSDGSKALFTSSEQLTDSDRNATVDLYKYDAAAPPGHRLTRVSLAAGDDPSTEAVVNGVMGASDDLSVVYFVAAKQLIPGQGSPEGGNIYVWREGEIDYVGDARSDADLYKANDFVVNDQRTVTPDGERLAFASDTAQKACGDPAAPSLCATGGRSQVYLYDADSRRLSCPSCRTDGAETDGTAKLSVIRTLNRGIVGFLTPITNLTDDGSRLFFNSDTALSPDDTNGAIDVYEWNEGAVRLVSSGHQPGQSQFVAASSDGGDVYLLTANRLVSRDEDDLYDLYDARDGGGFLEPPPSPPPCMAEACRLPGQTQPGFTAPSTANVSGAGNLKPQHKKHAKKHKKHRKHKKHAKRHKKHGKKHKKLQHKKGGGRK